MEVIKNLLSFKTYPNQVGALYLSRNLGTEYPFLPKNDLKTLDTVESDGNLLQKRIGFASRDENQKNGAKSPKDKTWVYRGTIGGAGAQTTTILGTQNGYKSYAKDRKLKAWKLRKRRRKYWRDPWVGDNISDTKTKNKTDSEPNAKEGRAEALVDLKEDLVAEASSVSSASVPESSNSSVANAQALSSRLGQDDQDPWHQRWAHLRYMDYMPKAFKLEGLKAFHGPRLTTTTERPNVFYGDDWIRDLKRERGKRGKWKKRKKNTSCDTRSGDCLVGDDAAQSLSLKFVPVFPDQATPYYKSVVVDEEGNLIKDEKPVTNSIDRKFQIEEEGEEVIDDFDDFDEDDDDEYYDSYEDYSDEDYYYDDDDDDDDYLEEQENEVDSAHRMDVSSSERSNLILPGGEEIDKKAGSDGQYYSLMSGDRRSNMRRRKKPTIKRRKKKKRTRKKRKRRRRPRPAIHLHIQQPLQVQQPQQQYQQPQLVYVDENGVDRSQGYGAPPVMSYGGGGYGGHGGVIYLDSDDGYGSTALLGLLPLLVAGGLAASLFLNNTGSGVTVSNLININGTTVTNTFTPTNTATATNTNNDNDMITNTNNNMNINCNDVTGNCNTNGGRRRRRKRDSGFRHKRHRVNYNYENSLKDDWSEFSLELRDTMFDIMGTTRTTFYDDFLRSSYQIRPNEVLNQMTTLSRKMSCADAKDKSIFDKNNTTNKNKLSGDCMDRIVCEHLSEDYYVFRNNAIIRAGEAFLVTLFRFMSLPGARSSLGQEVVTLMDLASSEECQAISQCKVQQIEECFAIM